MLNPDGPQSTRRLTYVRLLYQPGGDGIQIFFKQPVENASLFIAPVVPFLTVPAVPDRRECTSFLSSDRQLARKDYAAVLLWTPGSQLQRNPECIA